RPLDGAGRVVRVGDGVVDHPGGPSTLLGELAEPGDGLAVLLEHPAFHVLTAAVHGLVLPAEHGAVEGRGGWYVGGPEVEPAGGAGGAVVDDHGESLHAVRGPYQRDTGSGRPRVGGDAPQRDPTAGRSGGGSGRLGADGGAVLPGQHAGLGQSGE